MKTCLLLLTFMFISVRWAAGEAIILLNPQNSKLTRVNKDSVYAVPFYVKGSNPTDSIRISAVGKNEGSDLNGVDYRVLNLEPRKVGQQFSVRTLIRKDAYVDSTEIINLRVNVLSDPIKQTDFRYDRVDRNKKKAVLADFDPSDFEFTFLTGSNFNFFEKPQVKSFAGTLNLYTPNIIGKLGLQTGVSNINFSDQDPTLSENIANTILPRVNVLFDPKEGLKEGALYESIQFQRTLIQSISSWSYYLQPAYELSHNENYNLSLVGHLEFLWQRTTAVVKQSVSEIDTFAVRLPADQAKIFRSSRDPAPDRTTTSTFTNGYFGAGLLWNIQQKKKYNFSITGIAGSTTDDFAKRRQVLINNLNAPRRPEQIQGESANFFYFVRAILTEKYTKLNGTIGFDLRGNNNNSPQVALYFGARIDLDKFFSD